MVAVRYMGTKRVLGPLVKDALTNCSDHGRVADVFSGMCAIASQLSSSRSVFLSDILAFPTLVARAHCLQGTQRKPGAMLQEIYPLFNQHRKKLRREFAERLSRETAAIERGQDSLLTWMLSAPHVGNSRDYQRMASCSSKLSTCNRFRLTTLYFSAGYFSTAQAIDLDSLRFALDSLRISRRTATPLLAVWLATASRIINSPGHSAQFLKPTNYSSYRRLRRSLFRDVWHVFAELSHEFHPWGSKSWRLENSVVQGDALHIVENSIPDDVSVIYADPPYTRDQYSRFYHVFETLLLYDFPTSTGIGRYREDRYVSPFCKKSTVVSAFERLFCGIGKLKVPLVLSYPSDGMLGVAGINVEKFVQDHFNNVTMINVPNRHSTMGASKGPALKKTIENIFICK